MPVTFRRAKPTLHQSGLGMLYRCPKQYEWRYVRGLIMPPGSAAHVGSGTHRAVAADLTAKIEGGALLAEEAVREVARDGVLLAWNEGVLLTDDERERPEAEVRGEAVDKAVTLATLHHAEVAPSLAPVAVEKSWRLELTGFSHDLAGTTDILEARAIRDTKTSAKSPSGNAADTSLQLSMYALADKYVRGALPEAIHLDYLVALKNPKAMTLSTTRDEEDLAAMLERIAAALKQIEAGVFPPCDPASWCCSPRWCGYWGQCPYGGRGRTRPTKGGNDDGGE
ncbi:MAG: PD-(D/E)XK nuclease family protein [Elusimicrobiota bacterium]